MKLKFRAEKKDVVAFLWACLLLLIVVAMCVKNLYHSSINGINNDTTGFSWSWNFIPAFFPPYLGYTLIIWIAAIVLLTASLSSHFYTREKGFGFKEGKDEKGFGRFAKEDEYKHASDVEPVVMSARESTACGFPLVYDTKKNLVYVDNGEYHTLVIGATGSGKTSRIVDQQVNILGKAGESMVVTDPKGEIFAKHGEMLKEKGYDVIVVNFRDPKNGSCWNPYTLPYKYYKEGNKDKANELLNDMAINIAIDEKADDPFWTAAASDYLTGLSLAMFEDAEPDEISISTVNLMMTVGEEKTGASTYIKEYFKMKDPSSPAAINALGTVNAPQETKNSILSVLKQKIKVFAVTQNLSEMLSRSDFDMEKIGERKTAIFMIIQDEKTTYHALATIFIKQCYESLISVAQKNGGTLPIRTNFIIDEFQNMPKFKDITTMVTAARSRHIRMTMIIQNFAGLTQVYGKEDAETIRGNCGNLLYLLTGELSALEEISKLCGDKIVKVGKDKKEETSPFITVTELQRFKMGEVLLLRHRLPPLRTKIPGYFEKDFGWGKNNCNVPKAELPTHEQKPIKLFDIREYVKKKKEEKRNDLFGGSNPFSSNNPFGGGMTPSPFGSNSSPFGGMNDINQSMMPNPLSAYGASNIDNLSSQNNNFNPTGINNLNDASDPDLNIDDLVKKIDERIAELEAEEKADKIALDNEKKASEEKLVEDILPKDIVENNELSSNVIMPTDKIDFSSLTNIPDRMENIDKHDIMDDMVEDLSLDEDTIKEENINNMSKLEEVQKVDNIIQDRSDNAQSIYKNESEINRIMNQKENKDEDMDDLFD